jgi:glycosyltransferase involved in cell wall biosynthesis
MRKLGSTTAASPRLRVLMLVNRLRRGGGGAERFLVGLATHLPRERFDVVVCTTRPSSGPLHDALAAQGVELIELDRRWTGDVRAFARLGHVLRRRRIDVLHAHMFGSNLWGTLVGRLARVPVVVAQEHTWDYVGQPVRKFVDGRVIGRHADAFVAVSHRDAERMVALEGVPRHKIRVIPTAYVPRPTDAARDLRAELGIPPDAPVVGTAAVHRPQKALEVLLEAFAEVRERLPDAHLLLGGDGPRRSALEQRTIELELSGSVHFLGYWQDMGALMRALDVAAMSSDFEGTPLFAIECMAHRVPLVSTRVGGLHEVLEEGRSVTLVPPRDPAALAEAIEALLRDPERRRAQAAAAAEVAPRFEIESIAGEFGDLYERLIQDKNVRSR